MKLEEVIKRLEGIRTDCMSYTEYCSGEDLLSNDLQDDAVALQIAVEALKLVERRFGVISEKAA